MPLRPLPFLIAALVGAPGFGVPGARAAPFVACPASGSSVERSVGGTVRYSGAVAGRPEVCRVQRGDAPAAEFWFGIWDLAWPGADAAGAALRRVLTGPRDMSVTFDTQAAPGLQWHDTLRNRGLEELNVLGAPRLTLRIEHEREGYGGNTYHSIITQWREVATGMTIYQNYRHVSGHPEPGTSWDPVGETVAP